jgi:hypothetical protein
MSYIWWLAIAYLLIVAGLVAVVSMAPEGHEDERGFHLAESERLSDEEMIPACPGPQNDGDELGFEKSLCGKQEIARQ